ncbi:hypothetical protein [Bosea lathyri]|uniref:Uncharacterized protein n=1 Tax=Bosea lathyri TaxID=1036778 RepID=A0A1H6BXQ0_9HYPH|nr:hypothetical protein [Bosea lathyri]SEG64946.1 hypothetical protein SAMN04488115_108139 [Bosea lathyri]
MQTANIMLALGGDVGNTIPKYGVTAAEVALLRAVHGDEAVFDVEPTGEIERSNRAELGRLNLEYAGSRLVGTDTRAVSALFPGAAARVYESFDELELDESFFKAKTRVTANSAVEPVPSAQEKPAETKKATKGKKAAAAVPAPEPQAEDDGIEDMTDTNSAFS